MVWDDLGMSYSELPYSGQLHFRILSGLCLQLATQFCDNRKEEIFSQVKEGNSDWRVDEITHSLKNL